MKKCLVGMMLLAWGAHASQEKPLVIVIPSYKNMQLYKGIEQYKYNLDSVFAQEYENYRVIYIDDCSPDGTADAVEQYVAQCHQQSRVTIIRNAQRWGPSRNRFYGVHLCHDDEIGIFLDGDDWFAHNRVLSTVSEAYDNPDVWVTYSEFQTTLGNFSGAAAVPDWVIEKNAYREYGWYYHSLKTFRAWLFKQLKLEDLLYEGNFFPISSDLAEMFPLMELSGGHFQYIPEILYIALQHENNELATQGKELMMKMSAHIFGMPPYQRLTSPIKQEEALAHARADVLIFASDAQQLSCMLDQLNAVNGVDRIGVVFAGELSAHEMEDAGVECYRPHLHQCRAGSMYSWLNNFFAQSNNKHVFCITDQDVIAQDLDFNKAIRYLENTHAHAFYLQPPVGNAPLLHVGASDVYAWQFGSGIMASGQINTLHGALYRTQTAKNFIEQADIQTIDDLQMAFAQQKVNGHAIGIFFKQ